MTQSFTPAVSGALPVPVSFPSPTQFDAYARMAQQWPMLEESEEKELIQAWRANQDVDAARALVLSHLRLVVRIARDHRGYGLPEGDLAQEGTVGLMRAVHRFNPKVGVRLAAYASRWIEAEIREFIFKNFRLVRMGASSAMKKLFFGYRKTLASLRQMGEERSVGVSVQDVAQAMGVTQDQAELAHAFFGGRDLGWDTPAPGADPDEGPDQALMLEALPSDDSSPGVLVEIEDSNQAIERSVQSALAHLDERDRAIIQARRLTSPAVGLAELGRQWGVSAERIRQIEQRAFSQLKELLVQSRAQELLA